MTKWNSYGTASPGYRNWAASVQKVGQMEEQRLRDDMKTWERDARQEEKEFKKEQDKKDQQIKSILEQRLKSAEKEGQPINTAELLTLAQEELKKQEDNDFLIRNVLNLAKGMRALTTEKKPTAATLRHAENLSLKLKKDILLDYYEDSLNDEASIGVFEEDGKKVRVLVKHSTDDTGVQMMTSDIIKVYRSDQECVVETQNSLYIVSFGIKVRQLR